MSRSSKIVRFTFWMNNIFYLLLLALYIFGFYMTVTKFTITLSLLFVVGMLILFKWEFWYLRNKLGVSSTKNVFYFTDDERERYIAMRVSGQLIKTSSLILILLFILTGSLTNLYVMNVKLFGAVMIIAITIAMYWLNIQYYILWNKYSKE